MYIEWHRNPINKMCIAWCEINGDIITIVSEDENLAEVGIKAKICKSKGKGYGRFTYLAPTQSSYDKVPWDKLSSRSYRVAYYVNPKVLAAKAKAAGINITDEPVEQKESEMSSDMETKEGGYISETKGGYIHIYKIKKYEFEGDVDYELTDDGKLIVILKEKVNVYPLAV